MNEFEFLNSFLKIFSKQNEQTIVFDLRELINKFSFGENDKFSVSFLFLLYFGYISLHSEFFDEELIHIHAVLTKISSVGTIFCRMYSQRNKFPLKPEILTQLRETPLIKHTIHMMSNELTGIDKVYRTHQNNICGINKHILFLISSFAKKDVEIFNNLKRNIVQIRNDLKIITDIESFPFELTLPKKERVLFREGFEEFQQKASELSDSIFIESMSIQEICQMINGKKSKNKNKKNKNTKKNKVCSQTEKVVKEVSDEISDDNDDNDDDELLQPKILTFDDATPKIIHIKKDPKEEDIDIQKIVFNPTKISQNQKRKQKKNQKKKSNVVSDNTSNDISNVVFQNSDDTCEILDDTCKNSDDTCKILNEISDEISNDTCEILNEISNEISD